MNGHDRRHFVALVGTLAVTGCTSVTSANSADDSDPTERGGIELADVRPQPLESYVGISAVVYNGNSGTKAVTVEFRAYDDQGKQLHKGSDSVRVEARSEAPVSKYWEKNPDNSPFQGWDAKIISVK